MNSAAVCGFKKAFHAGVNLQTAAPGARAEFPRTAGSQESLPRGELMAIPENEMLHSEHFENLLNQAELSLWEPDGGNVGVGQALFEAGFSGWVGGARQNGVVVRQGVGAYVLGDFGEGLDGAVVGQAAALDMPAPTNGITKPRWQARLSSSNLCSFFWYWPVLRVCYFSPRSKRRAS